MQDSANNKMKSNITLMHLISVANPLLDQLIVQLSWGPFY